MGSSRIECSIILTIDFTNILNIPLVITDNIGKILYMTHTDKIGSDHNIRMKLFHYIDEIVNKYNIDTILFEQQNLFISRIDRYPDPYVLHNVKLGFSMKTGIQDRYYDTVKYILEIPTQDWRDRVLNKHTKYAIDLYKAHILLRDLKEEDKKIIDENNYYKALCMSESVLFDSLVHKKYQINK